MPIANSTTAANGSEREQILPLLDSVKLKTLKPGRPKTRVRVLAADKGYDSKEKRSALRKRGIRHSTQIIAVWRLLYPSMMVPTV